MTTRMPKSGRVLSPRATRVQVHGFAEGVCARPPCGRTTIARAPNRSLSVSHGHAMFSTEFPDNTRGRPVIPATAEQLGFGAARLFALAHGHGHGHVAAPLLTLFGQVECPTCGAFFCLGDRAGSPD